MRSAPRNCRTSACAAPLRGQPSSPLRRKHRLRLLRAATRPPRRLPPERLSSGAQPPSARFRAQALAPLRLRPLALRRRHRPQQASCHCRSKRPRLPPRSPYSAPPRHLHRSSRRRRSRPNTGWGCCHGSPLRWRLPARPSCFFGGVVLATRSPALSSTFLLLRCPRLRADSVRHRPPRLSPGPRLEPPRRPLHLRPSPRLQLRAESSPRACAPRWRLPSSRCAASSRTARWR